MNSIRDQFVIKSMFCHSESHPFQSRSSQQNMYAKQILRIAVAQTAIALGQAILKDWNMLLTMCQFLHLIIWAFYNFLFVLYSMCNNGDCCVLSMFHDA